MKRGLFVLLFLVVFILMVVVEYSGQDNQGFSSGSCPFMIPAEVGEENLEVIAQFDGVTILRVEENKGLYTRIGGYGRKRKDVHDKLLRSMLFSVGVRDAQ